MRTGIVLDNNTPALDRLLGLARWGLGGRVGPGTQWVSWVHIDDWLAINRAALAQDSTRGCPARNWPRTGPQRRSDGCLTPERRSPRRT